MDNIVVWFFLAFCAAALVLFLGGWVWLSVNGFRESALWGIVLGVFPTFGAPCFALYHWRAARLPMAMHYGGIVLIYACIEFGLWMQ